MDCIDHGQVGDLGGYGTTNWIVKGKRKSVRMHRAVYCKSRGLLLADISGKVVRHLCNNPRCINPEHLCIGTQADNMADRAQAGNTPRGSRNGMAKLTDAQIAEIRSSAESSRRIAPRYGVSWSQVCRIRRGTSR